MGNLARDEFFSHAERMAIFLSANCAINPFRYDQRQGRIKRTDFPTCTWQSSYVLGPSMFIGSEILVQAVYASIDGKQPSLAKFLSIRSISTHRSNGHYVTDIKQTCLGQGLGVTTTARKRPSKLMFTMKDLGHTLPGRQN